MNLLVAVLLSLPATARADDAAKKAQTHYIQGVLLERRGMAAEALAAYEEALKADPNSAYVGKEAAELALELGQPEKALAMALDVVRLEPDNAESQVLMGRVRWARGEMAEAQAAFEKALKLDPKSSDSVFSLSALLAASAPKKAKALLERFLREQPSLASEAHFQLAKIDLQQGNMPGAIKHLKQSVALDPDGESLPARYALAQAYEVEKSTPAALAEYMELAKLEPENTALLGHIGEIHAADDRWEEAAEWFDRARRLSPGDPSANHWLALYAEKQGDFDKAADYLKTSTALYEDAPLALRLSYYLSQAGKTAEAVAVLEEAHRRFPKNDQVSYFLALGYQDQKREKEAAKLLEDVVAVKPDYRDARYQLGVALERMGDLDGAEKQFRALLAQRPDDASALNYLGYTLTERGQKLGEAEEMIVRAVGLEPTNGAYQDSLGWVHHKQGKHGQAAAELIGALKLLPDDETVWEHLGDAQLAAGRPEEAWLAYKRSQAYTTGASAAAKKAYKLQKRFSREALGGLFQRHLASVQGVIKKLSGLAILTARVGPKTVKMDAITTFKAPAALTVEVLGGPFFSTVLRLAADGEEYEVTPFNIEGIEKGAAEEAAMAAVGVMRDFLNGKYLKGGAKYRRRWWSRKRWLEAGGARLVLDRQENVVAAVELEGGVVTRLDAEELARDSGRLVPRRLTARGKHFEIGLYFNEIKLDLEPLRGPGE